MGEREPADDPTDEVGDQSDDGAGAGAARSDLNPLRAAGWIFRDGACVEIERQADELRARVLAD